MNWVAWRSGFVPLTRNVEVGVRAPSKSPVVSLSKKFYPYCLVLVGSKNGFERDFTIELKQFEGLMEDRLKCQISPSLNIVKTKLTRIVSNESTCVVCVVSFKPDIKCTIGY